MQYIRVEQDGPVKTITMIRKEKRNALNLAILNEMTEAFRANPAPADQVIVLQAERPAFCSSIDLAERLEKPATPGESPIKIMLHSIEINPLPIIGVVHKNTIAGGNELALHCDFVIASTSTHFSMSLTQISLAPTWFLTKKLIEIARPVAAREILLLGDPLPSTKIYDLSIIGQVAPPYDLQREAQKIIDQLAANTPLSLHAIKSIIVRQIAFRDNIPHKMQNRLVEAARNSADSKKDIRARLEKRTADFKGV